MKKYIKIILVLFFIFPTCVLAESIDVQLEKCVDGDTAKFKTADGVVTTYRFLAIDTPETVHPTKPAEPFGKEASDYTCNALSNASKIVLELDDASDEKDRYGRGLAWIFVDDVLLQEQLISLGYAKTAYLYGDYKYTPILQEQEKSAKENKIGIWSTEEQKKVLKQEKMSKETKRKRSKKFLEDLIDSILEAITASISQMIDSILQSIEDMV